jgi:hypothetical protein
MGSTNEAREFVVRRSQAICTLGLLAVLLGTCMVTDLLARNRGLERWLMARSSVFAERNGTLFSYTGNFIDSEERLLLDELPQADYSRGGVYFFGTSNMKWAFQTWDLPVEQRRSIGNYGIGASSHTTELRFIRYLIGHRGFLASGHDLVIFGVSFHLGWQEPSTGVFGSLLRRRGLYTITPDDRIAPVPMLTVERWLRIEKARSSGFIWNLGRLAKGWVETFRGSPRPLLHDAAKYRQQWREFMGAQWQEHMDTEMERFRDAILLLRSHQTQVKVMLLPQGSDFDTVDRSVSLNSG